MREQTPCPNCGCRLYQEHGPCAGRDLLEALKGELAPSRSDCNERKCGACSRCRSYAAIAKAEGR